MLSDANAAISCSVSTTPKGVSVRAPGKDEYHDINAPLLYLEDLNLYKPVKPLQFTTSFVNCIEKMNVMLTRESFETIKDVRGCNPGNSIDGNGFLHLEAPTDVRDCNYQPTAAEDYPPEIVKQLHSEVGDCDEIIFYDARISQRTEQDVRIESLSSDASTRQVHTDNNARSVMDKISNLTALKAEYLS